MKRTRIGLALTATALVALGVLAGSVIGDDGTTPIVDRIPTDYPKPDVINVGGAARAQAAGGKATIIQGQSNVRTVAGGAIDAVTLRCPKRTVAVSGGYNTESAGVAPFNLGRELKADGTPKPRGYFIAVVNLNGSGDVGWFAEVTCEKGVKLG